MIEARRGRVTGAIYWEDPAAVKAAIGYAIADGLSQRWTGKGLTQRTTMSTQDASGSEVTLINYGEHGGIGMMTSRLTWPTVRGLTPVLVAREGKVPVPRWGLGCNVLCPVDPPLRTGIRTFDASLTKDLGTWLSSPVPALALLIGAQVDPGMVPRNLPGSLIFVEPQLVPIFDQFITDFRPTHARFVHVGGGTVTTVEQLRKPTPRGIRAAYLRHVDALYRPWVETDVAFGRDPAPHTPPQQDEPARVAVVGGEGAGAELAAARAEVTALRRVNAEQARLITTLSRQTDTPPNAAPATDVVSPTPTPAPAAHPSGWAPAPVTDPPEWTFPAVLEHATTALPGITITDRALTPVSSPQEGAWSRRAWGALRALNDYAQTPEPGAGFRDWLLRHPEAPVSATMVALRESESTTTRPRLRAARTFPCPTAIDPSGACFYGAHIKIGESTPSAPRLHFLLETIPVDGTVWVGYLGPHLKLG